MSNLSLSIRAFPSADVLNLREVQSGLGRRGKYNIVEATCTSACTYTYMCVYACTYVWNPREREEGREGPSGPSGGRYNKLEKATGHPLLPPVLASLPAAKLCRLLDYKEHLQNLGWRPLIFVKKQMVAREEAPASTHPYFSSLLFSVEAPSLSLPEISKYDFTRLAER